MSALSPPPFLPTRYGLEDALSQHNYKHYMHRESNTFAETLPDVLLSRHEHEQMVVHHQFDQSPPLCAANSKDSANMVKRLYHNASERDRRKKINSLYSSLRSLLPSYDQTKKLSIPNTISRALKYIPEIQQEVETLVRSKEELLSRISRRADLVHHERKMNITSSSLPSISLSRLGDREMAVQISTYKMIHRSPLSKILLALEDDGFLLVNAFSFDSFEGRIFYNLHFKMERSCKLESEVLIKEKLLSLYQ